MTRPDARLEFAILDRHPAFLLGADRVVVRVGAALRTWLGPDVDRWPGRPFEEIFPAGDPDPTLREGPADLPTRSRRLVRITEIPATRDRTLVLLDDRTEVERARSECLALTRLASAGRLISGIVHEINNPLSGIIGYAQLLLLRDLEADVRAEVEKIHEEAQRTSRIVRNLLDFSRKRAPSVGAVELGRVVRKALELKSHDLRVHGVSVRVDVPEDLPAVACDEQRFLQVLVNLITNAEQAMYESDRGGRLTLRARANDKTILVDIEDTGPGIAPEDHEKVFQPFFTTKPEGQGTGLGLALCREMLRAFGGSIQLVDHEKRGARFVVTLRRHGGEPAQQTEPSSTERAVRVRGCRIVVVEDDPVCRNLLRDAFERAGNRVYAFDRSEPALDHLRERGADAIVTDLHRPGINGIEFHALVSRFDEALAGRIVFLTGDTLNDDFVRFLRDHPSVFLPKPVQLQDLFAAVEQVVGPSAIQRRLFREPLPPSSEGADAGPS